MISEQVDFLYKLFGTSFTIRITLYHNYFLKDWFWYYNKTTEAEFC